MKIYKCKYSLNPLFDHPEDNTIIWRYFKDWKFIDLINTSALYFAKLNTFPYEGKYPKKMNKYEIIENLNGEFPDGRKLFIMNDEKKLNCKLINCWTINEHEDKYCWNNFVSDTEGVTIQSTFKRFKEAINQESEYKVYIGKVKYIDYSNNEFPLNPIYRYIHLPNFYSQQSEMRAIIEADIFNGTKHELYQNMTDNKSGAHFFVDLKKLIDLVIISPNASYNYYLKIKNILQAKNLDVEIRKSEFA